MSEGGRGGRSKRRESGGRCFPRRTSLVSEGGGGGGGLVFPLTLWTSLVRDVKDKDEIPLSSPHGDRAIQAIAPLMHVSACTCLRSAPPHSHHVYAVRQVTAWFHEESLA